MRPHEILIDLRISRRSKKITQAQLADAAGYDRVTITKYETGRTVPDISAVINIAEVLGYELTLKPKDKP